MCGIAGIYNYNIYNNVDQDSIRQLTKRIEHRGPDSTGYFINGNIALGHARLAIIDIENGVQPFYNEDKSLILVYNGEIYNYLELKSELVKLGCKFITDSDTEVVLKAYAIWGAKCLNKFNGMWSFAIWDERKRELFLSRDRMGIKPLYFIRNNDSFSFCSEIKGLLPETNMEIDRLELWDSLVMGPKHGGRTIYKNIIELYPGSYARITENRVSFNEYFKLEDTLGLERTKFSIETVENLLLDSIRIRLVSDVRLGTLNSGGLDSSLISSIASKISPNEIHTFSISPNLINNISQPGDESEFANLLSKYLNTSHNTIRYSQFELIDDLKESTFYNDSFLYHSNSVALGFLFRAIKNEYDTTVVLGGEGADEIFRGYSNNRVLNLYRVIKNIPVIEGYVRNKYFNKRRDLNWMVADQPYIVGESIKRNTFLNSDIVAKLISVKPEITEDRHWLFEKMSSLPHYDQSIFYEQKTYLVGLLQRVDRMSMRMGVEARVPFLDYRLVNYMNSFHFSVKSGITHKSVKKILKKISYKYLPHEIIERRKQGFATPTRKYKDVFLKKISDDFNINDKQLEDLSPDSIYLLYNFYLHKSINKYNI